MQFYVYKNLWAKYQIYPDCQWEYLYHIKAHWTSMLDEILD